MARGLCSKCYQKEIEEKHKRHARGLRIAAKKLTREYLIDEYFNKNKSLADIAKECGCSRAYVFKKTREYRMSLRTQSSAREIAIKKEKIVVQRVDEEGVTHSIIHQKIDLNKQFFAKWSCEMAYVLGVIFTDGCLHIDAKGRPHLSIGQKEPELLEKVLALMGCTAQLRYTKRREYGDTVAGAIYYFNFLCTAIYSDLLRLGLKPSKSLDIVFPDVPSEYVRHFIRGCWDGDGSVYIRKKGGGNPLITGYYSGSIRFVESLLAELDNIGLPKRTVYVKKGKQPCYYFKYHGTQCTKLYHFLYDGVPPTQYLERKHAIFKKHAEQQCPDINKYKQPALF